MESMSVSIWCRPSRSVTSMSRTIGHVHLTRVEQVVGRGQHLHREAGLESRHGDGPNNIGGGGRNRDHEAVGACLLRHPRHVSDATHHRNPSKTTMTLVGVVIQEGHGSPMASGLAEHRVHELAAGLTDAEDDHLPRRVTARVGRSPVQPPKVALLVGAVHRSVTSQDDDRPAGRCDGDGARHRATRQQVSSGDTDPYGPSDQTEGQHLLETGDRGPTVMQTHDVADGDVQRRRHETEDKQRDPGSPEQHCSEAAVEGVAEGAQGHERGDPAQRVGQSQVDGAVPSKDRYCFGHSSYPRKAERSWCSAGHVVPYGSKPTVESSRLRHRRDT